MSLLVERMASYAEDEQRETDIDPTRHAAIRVLGSRCFSDLGLLTLGAQ